MSATSGFVELARAEATGFVRTWRLKVLLVAAVFVAVSSPILAKYTPQILSSALGSSGADLALPDPTVVDAWTQWVKNASSLLIVVLVVPAAAALAGERSEGIAQQVVAGPTGRAVFVVAKAVVHALVVLVTSLVSALLTWLVASAVFGVAPLQDALVPALIWAVGALVVVTMTLAVSAASTASVLPAAVGIAVALLGAVPAMWEPLSRWTPFGLATLPGQIVTDHSAFTWAPVVSGLVSAVAFVAVAVVAFDRQEL